MCVQRSGPHEQGYDLFVVRDLTRIMQHVTIMGRHVGTRTEEEAHDWQVPPKTGMKDWTPAVLIISVHQRRIFGHPCLDGFQIAVGRRFMDGEVRHKAWVKTSG